MKIRKITTLTALISFVFLFFTSIVLFIVEGPDQVFLDIAKANNLTPKQLFEQINPQKSLNLTLKSLPESPESGTGNLTLTQFNQTSVEFPFRSSPFFWW